MSWKEIFKDNNDYNEKSIIGFCAFVVMVIVMLADVITGWTGSDLVINEAIYNSFVMVVFAVVDLATGYFGQDLVINETIYNSFVFVTLGSFGIAGLEKFAK